MLHPTYELDVPIKLTMRLILSVLLFTASFGAFADVFTPVKNAGIEGAIVPSGTAQSWHDSIREGRGPQFGIQQLLGVESQGFWTPQAKDITRAEGKIKAALKKYAAIQNGLSVQIEQILKHYNEYQRQYVGLIIDGKRHIYINSFSARDGASYTKHFVRVNDGGFWYWQIVYSVEDGTFFGLSINGEA